METLFIPANKKQKQLIHVNIPKDVKEEWVQWATNDIKKISCNDLSFDQANKILEQNKIKPVKLDYRAHFDKDNARHRYVLSLCIQYGWSKRGRVATHADLDKLNEWMHSTLCPVQKPLKDMNKEDLDKFIGALESMTTKRWSKPKKSKL
ncbi:hypothetical protein [Flavobacterium cerinum]|uniref:Uncharacterized protein n=1 Tax=Flavobacterium cerinum TaxID=2502784 RepID=A0A444HEG7_9FLAO|nr:hypothetical protein [Flavobacterium cerinum]RWX03388.1 hypothetical protein EPI11_00215 [Flavobacterium cerinum]